MNDSDVADFLLAHPAFFERHAELLGRIRLANPHGHRAVSLPERQIEMLREKNRQLERRWSELVHYGHENDGYALKFDRWSARLLAERHAGQLPDTLGRGLRDIFDVPSVEVRVWNVDPIHAALPAAQPVGDEIERFADSLGAPYCGANTGFAAAAWLTADGAAATAAPASGVSGTSGVSGAPLAASPSMAAASVALIPLRAPQVDPASRAFGLLVMGSPDPARFHDEMATDFLIRIGMLAGAALSRLLP